MNSDEWTDPAEACAAARSMLARGAPQQAAAALRQVIERYPTHVELCELLGTALVEMGDADTAMPFLRRAISLEPARASAHYELGLALVRVGRDEDARGELSEALRLRPDYPGAEELVRRLRAPGPERGVPWARGAAGQPTGRPAARLAPEARHRAPTPGGGWRGPEAAAHAAVHSARTRAPGRAVIWLAVCAAIVLAGIVAAAHWLRPATTAAAPLPRLASGRHHAQGRHPVSARLDRAPARRR